MPKQVLFLHSYPIKNYLFLCCNCRNKYFRYLVQVCRLNGRSVRGPFLCKTIQIQFLAVDNADASEFHFQEVFEDILEEAQYDDEIRYIDLKAIQSCRKQLTLAGNLIRPAV